MSESKSVGLHSSLFLLIHYDVYSDGGGIGVCVRAGWEVLYVSGWLSFKGN